MKVWLFPKKRNKVEIGWTAHFLDSIYSSGMLQDVANGVTRIKYDNGEEEKIAHAVLTSKYSHVISMYKESCKEVAYKPLSDTSLYRILHSIKPSRRKCLAGLDDTTAAGLTGFETLQNVTKKYNRKELTDALERSKRYVKTKYPIHCKEHCPCGTAALLTNHCIRKL